MTLKSRLALASAIAAVAAAAPFAASAHRAWILPSYTVLSGNDPWVGVDAAVSNDLFYPDHQPMRTANLKVIEPDGAEGQLQNASTGKFRSTFDLQLKKPGTYKIVQQGATSRTETFITRGAPTTASLKPTGKGLELQPVTHPNDLVAGEAAKFILVLDGKPAPNVEVTVLPGDSRYRNQPGEIKATTGADGAFSVTWPEAGYYWMNAAVKPAGVVRTAAQTGGRPDRGVTYTATFEVMAP